MAEIRREAPGGSWVSSYLRPGVLATARWEPEAVMGAAPGGCSGLPGPEVGEVRPGAARSRESEGVSGCRAPQRPTMSGGHSSD